MAKRSKVLILAILGLLCGFRNTGAQVITPRPDVPQDRAAITEQLISHAQDSYATTLEIAKSHSEEAFEIVRDHWQEVQTVEQKRALLFAFVRSANPHLLEILDRGTQDPNPEVLRIVYEQLLNFTFRNFLTDPAAYHAWHEGIAGKKPAEIVTTGCKEFVERFLQADAAQQKMLFQVLSGLDFNSPTDLAQLRRRTAVDAGLLNGLAKYLTQPLNDGLNLSYAQMAFQIVQSLQPDEAFIKQTLAPLTARAIPPSIRRSAATMMGTVNSAWAADRLLDVLKDDLSDTERMILLSMVASRGQNLYLIPNLIGLLEAESWPATSQRIRYLLTVLTKTPPAPEQDAAWWRNWWSQNKTRYPPDLQAVAIPKLPKRPSPDRTAAFITRHTERRLLGGDAQRAYWLLCPGAITPENRPGVAPPKPTYGLIVALADGVGDGSDLADFWKEAIQKSLKDGYFVALPVAPRWDAHQPTSWVTQQNMSQVKGARFSTEAFLNDIVKDVQGRYPIDPHRLILHGIGEGGLAAYACSLSGATPFQGFYILSSPFRTAQLPSLASAKGHRYLIQQSKEDKRTPYFHAAAAEEMLRKQSAVVKLVVTQGEYGYKFADSPWEQVSQAIGWLEAPH